MSFVEIALPQATGDFRTFYVFKQEGYLLKFRTQT